MIVLCWVRRVGAVVVGGVLWGGSLASCGGAGTNPEDFDGSGSSDGAADGGDFGGPGTGAASGADGGSAAVGGSSSGDLHTIDVTAASPECGNDEIPCNGTCVSEGGGEKNGCTLIEWTTVIRDMLLVGDQLYVASVGWVSRLNDQDQLETVASKGGGMQGSVRLAAIGSTIYFAQEMPEGFSIFEIGDTEEPLTLAEGLPRISDFVGGGETLLLVMPGEELTELVSYHLGTGATEIVDTGVNELGADDSHFYWTASEASGEEDAEPVWSIYRAPVDAPSQVEVFFTSSDVSSFSDLWVLDENVVFRGWSGTVTWLAKEGRFSQGAVSRSRSGPLQISGDAVLRIREARGEYADGLWGSRLSADSPDGGDPLFLGSWEEGSTDANFFVANEQFAYFQVGLTHYRIRVR